MQNYIEHTRNRKYMSGVERDKHRIKQTAEVFTPTPLVQEMLNKLEEQDPTLFTDHTKTFLDNSCGDCQFLSEVVIKKMEKSGCTLEEALKTTYGVELMEDNVKHHKNEKVDYSDDKEFEEYFSNLKIFK
jgi:hypothetical protein